MLNEHAIKNHGFIYAYHLSVKYFVQTTFDLSFPIPGHRIFPCTSVSFGTPSNRSQSNLSSPFPFLVFWVYFFRRRWPFL